MTAKPIERSFAVSDCLYHMFAAFPHARERYACTIIEINGPRKESRDYSKHLDGKTDADVEVVRFMRTKSLTRIPHGIAAIFPKIRTLVVNDCKVSAIERADLAGLGSLKELSVRHAPLAFLGADAFRDLASLEILDFYDTKLATVDERLFDGMPRLQAVCMLKSASINAVWAASDRLWPGHDDEPFARAPTLQELRRIVKGRPPCDAVCADLKKLLASHAHRDFTLTARESGVHGLECEEKCCNEVMTVHRFLLVARCPKLAAMIGAEATSLHLVDFPAHALKRVVEFFYSGVVPSPSSDPCLRLEDLRVVAEKLEIEEILAFVRGEMGRGDNVDCKGHAEAEKVEEETDIESGRVEEHFGEKEGEKREKKPQVTLTYRKSLKKAGGEEAKEAWGDDFERIEFEDQYEIIDDFYDEICSQGD